jgi:bla regulator protein BlaR1
MKTKSRELLAVGMFGGKSHIGDRIEILLRRGRTFSPRVSATGVAASAIVLAGMMLGGSLVPRWIAFAQAPRPSFEVASLKPSGPNDRLMYRLEPGGRYLATGLTLKLLIANAYGVPELRISGGPGWRDSDKFNLEAKVGIQLPPWPDSQKQLSLMLQSLLEERFKLALHRETREEPVYELVAAKAGVKLKTAKADESPGFQMDNGRIHSMAVPLDFLATNLAYLLGRTVIDKTGLAGKYSFTVTYMPDDAAPADTDGPSLFTALQDQLGLKLESSKGPVELLVIDRVEKPDAN